GKPMHIELTEQERLRAQQGQPVEVIDPQTKETYILIAKPNSEQVQAQPTGTGSAANVERRDAVIPEGIRLAQEAFRRDLPGLLEQQNLFHQWVAYHRQERIGIARDGNSLLDECIKRGLAENEFYLGWIDRCELIEEE